jgi:hypothetical protein
MGFKKSLMSRYLVTGVVKLLVERSLPSNATLILILMLLSTLLQDILHPSHHLLNVLIQIANKLGLSNKKTIITTNNNYYCFDY